jgi:hypothetical protein
MADSDSPFESIEGAHEYVHLLEDAIVDTRASIADDIVAATEQNAERRLDALRLVEYKLKQLHEHMHASGRLLNDLRTLRRLLLGERDARSA